MPVLQVIWLWMMSCCDAKLGNECDEENMAAILKYICSGNTSALPMNIVTSYLAPYQMNLHLKNPPVELRWLLNSNGPLDDAKSIVYDYESRRLVSVGGINE